MSVWNAAAEMLWRNAWAAVPLVLVIALTARYAARRAATRHVLWLVALLGFVAPVLSPLVAPLMPTPRQSADALTHVAHSAHGWWLSQGESSAPRDLADAAADAAATEATPVEWPSAPRVVSRPSQAELGAPRPGRAVRSLDRSRERSARRRTAPRSAPEADGAGVQPSAPSNFDALIASPTERLTAPAAPVAADADTDLDVPGEPRRDTRPVLAGMESLPAKPVPGGFDLRAARDATPPPALRAPAKVTSPPAPPTLPAEIVAGLAAYLAATWAALAALPAPDVTVWGAVLALGAGWFALSSLRFLIRLRNARPAPDGVCRAVHEVARSMGLRRVPRTYLVDARISPMIWCLGPPRLLLPTALWAHLRESERRAIICHELAHLRRGDHWTCLAELLVTLLYWWHPLTWWVRRRLDEEADLSCDAWVTWLRPRERRAYADALLRTKVFIAHGGTAAPAAAKGVTRLGAKTLARRLSMVMTESAKPRPSSAGLLLAGLIATAGWLVAPAWSNPPETKDQPVVVIATTGASCTHCEDASACEHVAKLATSAGGNAVVAVAGCDKCTHAAECDHAPVVTAWSQAAPGTSNFVYTVPPGTPSPFGDAPTGYGFSTMPPAGVHVYGDALAVPPAQVQYYTTTPEGGWVVGPTNLFGGAVGVGWQRADSDQDEEGDDSFDRLSRDMQRMARDLDRLRAELEKMRAEQRGGRAAPGLFGTQRVPRGAPSAPTPPAPPPAPPAAPRADAPGEVIVKSYRLPEGKLDALFQLMVRDDVPVPVAVGDGTIEVHATEGQHRVFAAFIHLIHPQSGGRGAAPSGRMSMATPAAPRLRSLEADRARQAIGRARAHADQATVAQLLDKERMAVAMRDWRAQVAEQQEAHKARARDLLQHQLRLHRDVDSDGLKAQIRELMEMLERVLEQAEQIEEETEGVMDEMLDGGPAKSAEVLAALEARLADISTLAEALEEHADTISESADELFEEIDDEELRSELTDELDEWLDDAVELCEAAAAGVSELAAPYATFAAPPIAIPAPLAPPPAILATPAIPGAPAPVAAPAPPAETFRFQPATPAPAPAAGGR